MPLFNLIKVYILIKKLSRSKIQSPYMLNSYQLKSELNLLLIMLKFVIHNLKILLLNLNFLKLIYSNFIELLIHFYYVFSLIVIIYLVIIYKQNHFIRQNKISHINLKLFKSNLFSYLHSHKLHLYY